MPIPKPLTRRSSADRWSSWYSPQLQPAWLER